jgi:hypothetical protein
VSSGTVFGRRAAALAPAAPWALGSFFGSFHHAERAPRVISSLTAESSTIKSLKIILRADRGILTTRVMRARKTRKCSNASDVIANRKRPSLDIETESWRIPVSLYQAPISRRVLQCNCLGRRRDPEIYSMLSSPESHRSAGSTGLSKLSVMEWA